MSGRMTSGRRRHLDVREIGRDRIGDARNGAQIHAEVWVGMDMTLHERAVDRGGHRGTIPVAGLVAGARKRFTVFAHVGGLLDGPVLAEKYCGRVGLGGGGNDGKRQGQEDTKAGHAKRLRFICRLHARSDNPSQSNPSTCSWVETARSLW